MIKINNLTKKFANQLSLDNVSLELNKGENIIIMGQNGAGKTTLIRSILGQYLPTKGEIFIANKDPFKDRVNTLKLIGFVPQLPPPIRLTVEELISYSKISSNVNIDDIFKLCKKMDLDLQSHLNKVFFKLSGGMKQKLLIAIAIAKNPDIFIFDEPTANLDPKGREMFYSLLDEYNEKKLMIFVSHRIDEVSHIINRKIQMDLGKVISDEKI